MSPRYLASKSDTEVGDLCVRFAPNVSLHLIDTGGLVLCESLQMLFDVNTTGAFIWCCLEEGMTLDETARQLVDSMGARPDDAASFVRDSVNQWWDLGFVAGSPKPPIPDQELATTEETPRRYDGPKTNAESVSRTYGLLDSTFRVRFPSKEIAKFFDPAFSHLEANEAAEQSELIIIPDGGGQYSIIADGNIEHEDVSRNRLVPTLNTHFLIAALNQGSYFLALHGGALQNKDKVVILAGPAGSGKSTVTAALMHAGYQYLTDDTVVLSEPDLALRPVPMSLATKEGSWSVLASRYPELAQLPTHSRIDGRNIRYISPSARMVRSHAAVPRVSNIFFLTYREASIGQFLPIETAEAIRRLLSRDWNYTPKPLEKTFVSRFVDWISAVECQTLEFDSPEDAVTAIESVLR